MNGEEKEYSVEQKEEEEQKRKKNSKAKRKEKRGRGREAFKFLKKNYRQRKHTGIEARRKTVGGMRK